MSESASELTIIEKVLLLQAVDVFSDLPTEELAYIASISQEVRFSPEDRIYEQQDRADALYLVLEGRVRLHRGSETIAEVGQGESFGVWALFDEEPRVTAATAAIATHTLRVEREEFLDLLADHVRITQGILSQFARRLRGLLERIASPGSGGRR